MLRRTLVLVGLLAATPAAAQSEDRPPDYIDEDGMPVFVDDPGAVESLPPPVTAHRHRGRHRYCGMHPIPQEWGGGFDATSGAHEHDYPPLDPYLFTERDGCYYFIGDPRDFGYTGGTYSYYGAHPVAYNWGGGFCYHMGTHFHAWAPFGPYFVMYDGWWGWAGPLPYYFWWYYPVYYRYYSAYYPRYYAGGRYYQPPSRGGLVGRPPPPPPPPRARGGSMTVVQAFQPRAFVPQRPVNVPQGRPPVTPRIQDYGGRRVQARPLPPSSGGSYTPPVGAVGPRGSYTPPVKSYTPPAPSQPRQHYPVVPAQPYRHEPAPPPKAAPAPRPSLPPAVRPAPSAPMPPPIRAAPFRKSTAPVKVAPQRRS